MKKDIKNDNTGEIDLSRRKAFRRLGLVASAVYAAPVLMTLSQSAHAADSSSSKPSTPSRTSSPSVPSASSKSSAPSRTSSPSMPHKSSSPSGPGVISSPSAPAPADDLT